LKIAFLTTGIYPLVIGGMQKHAFYFIKYLASRGIELDIYHFASEVSDYSKLPEQYSSEELKHINFIPFDFPRLFRFPGHYILASYLLSKRYYKVFHKNSYDLIYAKGFTSWYFLRNRKSSSPKVFAQFHGLEMFQKTFDFKSKLKSLPLRFTVRQIIKRVDYIFTYGGKIHELHKFIGCNENQLIPTSGFIPLDSIKAKPILIKNHIRNFLFIGRNERRKGYEELAIVIQELIPNYEFNFSFVGDIPNVSRIRNKNITYYGPISNKADYEKVILKADILVLPSISEGFPTVIIEAMAKGLSVIATDVGANETAVSADNGWLIKANDRNELKSAMIEALSLTPKELYNKKEASLEIVRNKFCWENNIDSIIDNFVRAAEN
jgi:glycosyltransferase involved in cell wall biosynthesis